MTQQYLLLKLLHNTYHTVAIVDVGLLKYISMFVISLLVIAQFIVTSNPYKTAMITLVLVI